MVLGAMVAVMAGGNSVHQADDQAQPEVKEFDLNGLSANNDGQPDAEGDFGGRRLMSVPETLLDDEEISMEFDSSDKEKVVDEGSDMKCTSDASMS
jgi:hypothetical protein